MVRGERCIVMITALAHRVKVGVACDFQVIKRTVAGCIIDIVIITVVIVVVIQWPLRCIDFCGCSADDHWAGVCCINVNRAC